MFYDLNMKATDRSKQCEQCKKTFYCLYGIGAGRWEKRKVCSKKCGAASRMAYEECVECGKEFHRSNLMSRKKKTCSEECRAKTLHRALYTSKQKTCLHCNKTYFVNPFRFEQSNYCSSSCSANHRKIWEIPYVRETGEKHHSWVGDLIGYRGLHHWVNQQLGRPSICSECGKSEEETRIHWANKNHEYKREKSGWINLCAKCHYQYDFDHNLRGNYA